MTVKLAKYADGIPVVTDATDRGGRFATPDTNQRVHNLDTGSIQRYTGSAWVDDFGPVAQGRYHVEDYLAVGGDTGDQASAINAAAAAAIAAGGILTGTPGTTYKVTSALDWEDLKYCDFTGVEIHSTITSGYALTIGGATSNVLNAALRLPAIRGDQSGSNGVDGNPLPEGDGIRIRGLVSSNVYFQLVSFWEKGCHFEGSVTDGLTWCAWNNFYNVYFSDCVSAGMHIQPGHASSFVNENRVFGGHLRINSTYANETGSTLLRMDDFGASSNPNGWTFFGVSLEGNILNTLDVIAGANNIWIGCRWEGANAITFGSEAIGNVITHGASVSELLVSGVVTDNGTRNGVFSPVDGFSVWPIVKLLADSATPSVLGAILCQAHANGTTITNFADGVEGQKITLQAASALTITHNTSNINLGGAGDFVMANQDILHLAMYTSGKWREISRTTVA